MTNCVRILMADDDNDDCLLVQRALHEVYTGTLQFSCVSHGEALLKYLQQTRATGKSGMLARFTVARY